MTTVKETDNPVCPYCGTEDIDWPEQQEVVVDTWPQFCPNCGGYYITTSQEIQGVFLFTTEKKP